jgi:hypothetical protein
MAGTHTSAALWGVPEKAAGDAAVPTSFKTLGGLPALVVGVYWGGKGRVYGTVKIKGTPDYAVSRRVRLFRDRDGVCVGEVWSNPTTGAYEFTYVDPTQRYTVVSYDHLASFRAVVADNLTPELMT